MANIIWECIGDNTHKGKVIGGWLVRYDNYNTRKNFDDRGNPIGDDYLTHSSMIFVPDEGHTWDMENLLRSN